MRRRRSRKRALGTRAPLVLPKQVNHRWSLDFASDALLDSRRFGILAVVDDFSRESLALVSRHVAVWRSCCPRARSYRGTARLSRHDCQRQWH